MVELKTVVEILKETNLQGLTSKNFAKEIRKRIPEIKFSFLNGATKGVLIIRQLNKKVVIKFPIISDEYKTQVLKDFCQIEREFYESIPKELKTIFLHNDILTKSKDGVTIYTQKKVDREGYERDLTPEEEEDYENNFVSRMYNNDMPYEWIKDVGVYYSYEIQQMLLDFVFSEELYDLRDCNLGYIKNKPVIFDYGGI